MGQGIASFGQQIGSSLKEYSAKKKKKEEDAQGLKTSVEMINRNKAMYQNIYPELFDEDGEVDPGAVKHLGNDQGFNKMQQFATQAERLQQEQQAKQAQSQERTQMVQGLQGLMEQHRLGTGGVDFSGLKNDALNAGIPMGVVDQFVNLAKSTEPPPAPSQVKQLAEETAKVEREVNEARGGGLSPKRLSPQAQELIATKKVKEEKYAVELDAAKARLDEIGKEKPLTREGRARFMRATDENGETLAAYIKRLSDYKGIEEVGGDTWGGQEIHFKKFLKLDKDLSAEHDAILSSFPELIPEKMNSKLRAYWGQVDEAPSASATQEVQAALLNEAEGGQVLPENMTPGARRLWEKMKKKKKKKNQLPSGGSYEIGAAY